MKAMKEILTAATALFATHAAAAMVGQPAKLFKLKNQNGVDFDLESRRNKGYTVLFFYPKAGTPGCTKQACAFRDAVDKIRKEGAEVYGISADSVDSQKAFHYKHHMTFDLLSGDKSTVLKDYGVEMPVVHLAKRQTFILDNDLKIVKHFEDVDPAVDAANVAAAIKELKARQKV